MDVAGGELVCLAGRHEFGEARTRSNQTLRKPPPRSSTNFAQKCAGRRPRVRGPAIPDCPRLACEMQGAECVPRPSSELCAPQAVAATLGYPDSTRSTTPTPIHPHLRWRPVPLDLAAPPPSARAARSAPALGVVGRRALGPRGSSPAVLQAGRALLPGPGLATVRLGEDDDLARRHQALPGHLARPSGPPLREPCGVYVETQLHRRRDLLTCCPPGPTLART